MPLRHSIIAARLQWLGIKEMLRLVHAAAAALAALMLSPGAVRAEVVVTVNKASQSMTVSVNGTPTYTWTVSTGVYGTPSGSFRPQSLSRYHRSSLFNNAPMPYSIFYDGHYAIHGTDQVQRLGAPASRGCVRLHPDNAAVLFALVQQEGMGNIRIHIQ
jgi:lipoprotein-anchoring transpeptidase ErfK/SrfK